MVLIKERDCSQRGDSSHERDSPSHRKIFILTWCENKFIYIYSNMVLESGEWYISYSSTGEACEKLLLKPKRTSNAVQSAEMLKARTQNEALFNSDSLSLSWYWSCLRFKSSILSVMEESMVPMTLLFPKVCLPHWPAFTLLYHFKQVETDLLFCFISLKALGQKATETISPVLPTLSWSLKF